MKKLSERVNALPLNLRTIFDRIYEVTVEQIDVTVPPSIQSRFGADLTRQEVIMIKNLVLGQQTVFSPARARKPEPPKAVSTVPADPFDTPGETAPADTLGRLENDGAFSANNIFKAAPFHSLIVFKSHNPQALKQNEIQSGLNLATEWFTKVRMSQPKLSCGLLIWNYLGRAGASITHPHLQIFALPELPPRLIAEQTLVEAYRTKYQSDYFADAYAVHQALGLAKTIDGVRIFIRLTPFKDREVMLFGEGIGGHEPAIARLLAAYRGLTESFDLLLLNETNGLLPLGFAVDRGSLSRDNSDIGSLELYAFSIVAFDPFDFAAQLFTSLEAK